MVTLVTSMPVDTLAPSDLQLVRNVEGRLKASGIAQLQKVICEYHGQVMFLRGRVDSYYLKQLVQELVKQAAPQMRIVNLVTVG